MVNARKYQIVWLTGLLMLSLFVLLAVDGSQARMMEVQGKKYDIAQPGEFKSGEVIVRLHPGTTEDEIQGMAAQMQGRVKARIPEYHLYLLEVPPQAGMAAQKAQVDETARNLERFAQVKRAYPNFKVSIPKPPEVPANQAYAKDDTQVPGVPAQQGVTAQAISAENQWHLDKIKFHNSGAAPAAPPMVAVLDTGVDYTHPDLAANVVLGWDFVDNDDDPMDEGGHGTHMAGLIAASPPGGGTGTIGISPTSKVLAVRVLDQFGAGTWFHVMQGIVYARNSTAKILNLSLVGYDLPGSSAYTDLQEVIDDTVAAGKIVCVAAGNDDNFYAYDDIHYFAPPNLTPLPAGIPNSFTVTASEWNDCRVYFSNYDVGTLRGVAYNFNFVDLAAPGWKIYSTVPVSQGDYGVKSGTSAATAIVAGCAARVWAKYPTSTAAQVQNRLISTGSAVDSVNGFYSQERRVDLMKALGRKATGFSGVVFNGQNGGPLSGVTVTATPSGVTVKTNASGFFTITGLTGGTTYSLKFSRSGFGSSTLNGQVAVADRITDLALPKHLPKKRADGEWTVLFSYRNFHPGYQDAVYSYLFDWWPVLWNKTSGLRFAPRLERNGAVIVEPASPGNLTGPPFAALTNDDWNKSSGSQNLVISQVQSGTYRIWTRLDNFNDTYYEWGSYQGAGQKLKARIYNGAGLEGTAVATQATGAGPYWWVADLVGGVLTIRNKMGTTAPPF